LGCAGPAGKCRGPQAAHQWFYHAAGNDQLDELWLGEALVQHVTGWYHLDVGGELAAQARREFLYDTWELEDQAEVPIGLALREYNSPREARAIVYGRGHVFLAARAEEMGQAVFDAFLRDYYQSYK
jgi:hypothetical protein